jgi:hypothetical protein
MRSVEWRVGPAPDLRGEMREVRIVEMAQIDGTIKFAVKEGPWAANKSGEWEWEPLPSSRDDAYFERCRWDQFDDAALMAQRMAKEIHGV